MNTDQFSHLILQKDGFNTLRKSFLTKHLSIGHSYLQPHHAIIKEREANNTPKKHS